MTTLTVGTGQQYGTISAAVAAAKTGDTINVQAGTYTNDFPALINGLTIQGVGGIVKLVATAQPSNGKAILDVAGNTTLRNLDISGVTVPDANGAAIRYESGNLLIQNTVIHGNQNGILGAASAGGTITIDGSEFYNNGTSSGSTHNIYIGDIATFTLTNSYIHDANTGHEVKSRAENNVITNNRIEDGNSTASYQIDLPNGGNATIAGNTIQKSANSGNHVTIAYGEEGNPHAGTTVSITNNTFVSDQSGAYVIWDTTNAAVSASGNSLYNVSQIDKSGHVSSSGFSTLSSRPTLDTSSPIKQSSTSSTIPTPTPTPAPVPTPVTNPTPPVVAAPPAPTPVPVSKPVPTPTPVPTPVPLPASAPPTIVSAGLAGTNAVLIKGTAQANSKISLNYTTDGYNRAVATGTTASDGTWSITATTVDPRAVNSFAVSATTGTTTTAGSDTLTLASTYSDPLFATAGKVDVFAFAPNSGRDILAGFDATSGNHDIIDLVGTSYHSFEQLQSKISGTGSAVISLTGNDTIIVAGVNPNALTAVNFRFT